MSFVQGFKQVFVAGGLTIAAIAAPTSACAADAASPDAPTPYVTFSGSAAVTTDYIFRGITQTQGDPAAQAGFKAALENGLYGAVWGSNVEFAGDPTASLEADYVLGWSGKLADDWALDVNLTHFDYPASHTEPYTELIGTVTFRDNYALMVGYSNDIFGTGATGIYTQLGARLPVNDGFRFEGAIAHYALDDAYDDSYSFVQLSGVWAFRAPFELRVSAYDTDNGAKRIFPGLAGPRIEAALQASF